MDDCKWTPLHPLALYFYTDMHAHQPLSKVFFHRFVCLHLVWEKWKQNISTDLCNNLLRDSLWNTLSQKKAWILLCVFFFSFFHPSLLSSEITLTVTYIHNSSYILFMAFQQLCNPRGWKYFPFATVTRAVERKYGQLQASLIMVSDNTVCRISVYHFSLMENADLLLRHLMREYTQTMILWIRSKCSKISSIYSALQRDCHQYWFSLF